MEGVAEDQLVAELCDVGRGKGAHASARGKWDERRRRDGAVSGEEPPGAGRSVARGYLEGEAFGVRPHGPRSLDGLRAGSRFRSGRPGFWLLRQTGGFESLLELLIETGPHD